MIAKQENKSDPLVDNDISAMLDDAMQDYARTSGRGSIMGIVLADQDAKVIARSRNFNHNQHWDMGALGAAMYGIGKQGQAYFGCSDMKRAIVAFGDKQLFIHDIGSIDVDSRGPRHLLLGKDGAQGAVHAPDAAVGGQRNHAGGDVL